MTDSALLPTTSRFASVGTTDKTDAFRRAARHSSRVRWLRIGILVGAVGGCVGIIGYAFFDPFRAVLPSNVSIDSAGLSGSRITMARPKMSGFRKDGRPYNFVAKTAVQDLKAPNVLELNELDAHVTMSGATVAHITATSGLYDSSSELMDLKGDIHITSDSGYDVRMSTAHIEFKGGNVASKTPVIVVTKTGTVNSDAMTMTGNGTEITFLGNVHSVMLPASEAETSVGQMKGTAP